MFAIWLVIERLESTSRFTIDLKGMTMRLARKFTLAAATTALVIYSSGVVRSDEPPTTEVWTMEITPAANRHAVSGSVPVADQSAAAAPNVDPAEYERIYKSIPFSRAEFRVNPGYRHDSAMEILTGNARHQTIVRHNHEHKQPVRPNPAPARPSRILTPFSSWSHILGIPYGFRSWF